MSSPLMNRIAQDIGIDMEKLRCCYDDAVAQANTYKGWSPNEGRYWRYVYDNVGRQLGAVGVRSITKYEQPAQGSRALRSLLKSILSEYEAERMGMKLA